MIIQQLLDTSRRTAYSKVLLEKLIKCFILKRELITRIVQFAALRGIVVIPSIKVRRERFNLTSPHPWSYLRLSFLWDDISRLWFIRVCVCACLFLSLTICECFRPFLSILYIFLFERTVSRVITSVCTTPRL